MKKRALVAAILVTIVSANLTMAEKNCLDTAASQVGTGSKLVIVNLDGSRLSGFLSVIDLEQRALTLIPPAPEQNNANIRSFRSRESADTTPTPVMLSIDDIAMIQYRKRGEIQPAWVIAGGFAGFLIPFVTIDGEEKHISAFMGMSLGVLAGVVLAPFFPSTRTIKCTSINPEN